MVSLPSTRDTLKLIATQIAILKLNGSQDKKQRQEYEKKTCFKEKWIDRVGREQRVGLRAARLYYIDALNCQRKLVIKLCNNQIINFNIQQISLPILGSFIALQLFKLKLLKV